MASFVGNILGISLAQWVLCELVVYSICQDMVQDFCTRHKPLRNGSRLLTKFEKA